MKNIELKFNGMTFSGRYVKSNDGEDLLIADTDYLDALQPGSFNDEKEGFVSEEAERLYDEVFYFVSPKELLLPDDELINVLKADNPDWFEYGNK